MPVQATVILGCTSCPIPPEGPAPLLCSLSCKGSIHCPPHHHHMPQAPCCTPGRIARPVQPSTETRNTPDRNYDILLTCRCIAMTSAMYPPHTPAGAAVKLLSAPKGTPKAFSATAVTCRSSPCKCSCRSHSRWPFTRPCRRAQTSTATAVPASAAHTWRRCRMLGPVRLALHVCHCKFVDACNGMLTFDAMHLSIDL